MKALLTNYRQSPRKVRLVADVIRGKGIAQARAALTFMPHKASPAILKLMESAVANARNQGLEAEALFVKAIQVNKGTVMRRFSPKARGRAGAIRKTLSIVSIELGVKGGMRPVAKAKPVEVKKEEAAPKAKEAPVKKTARKTAAKKTAKKATTK